jgi:hypothetical protein
VADAALDNLSGHLAFPHGDDNEHLGHGGEPPRGVHCPHPIGSRPHRRPFGPVWCRATSDVRRLHPVVSSHGAHAWFDVGLGACDPDNDPVRLAYSTGRSDASPGTARIRRVHHNHTLPAGAGALVRKDLRRSATVTKRMNKNEIDK